MNVFRLVLCLSGLATYLVVRHLLQPVSAPDSPQSSSPAQPEAVVPKTPKPQTMPHVEILPPERSLVSVKP